MKVDINITDISNKICSNINIFKDKDDIGLLSQNILSDLRHFVEAVVSKIYLLANNLPDMAVDYYKTIVPGLDYIKNKHEFKFIKDFHKQLQISISHYTRDPDNSERLLYKYIENLYKIRSFLKTNYGMEVLENLETISLNNEGDLSNYYKLIAQKIEINEHGNRLKGFNESYYIWKKKPFFINGKIYYEITAVEANDKISKFDRFVFYTKLDINPNYAIRIDIVKENVLYDEINIPVILVTNYEVSIRPCEIMNYANILGQSIKIDRSYADYRKTMQYLKKTNYSLVEIIYLDDNTFYSIINAIDGKGQSKGIINILQASRNIILKKSKGSNILKFLLLNLNNRNIKSQSQKDRRLVLPNNKLSRLRLNNGCLPFEEMPFCSSPLGTNVRLSDLFEIIETDNREHEFLARFIIRKAEIEKQIYTDLSELTQFNDIERLIKKYNGLLHHTHKNREIEIFKNKKIYIKAYDTNVAFIINEIAKLTKHGVDGYNPSVISWLNDPNNKVDSLDKQEALKKGFTDSLVFVIYGAAGTGKTKLLEHFGEFFMNANKIYLTYTHAALENLKRRVNHNNASFYTVKKYLNGTDLTSGILIIDECSTISNEDMRMVLEKSDFKILLLSGDPYQIESITFGNWFDLLRKFIPNKSYVELTIPHRTTNEELIKLWNSVRKFDENIEEYLTAGRYSYPIDKAVVEKNKDNEIILCLNYDGLYGINNINRVLQQKNPNESFMIGANEYKIGDPILFNENSIIYEPLLYNNAKGTITNIYEENGRYKFHIELDKIINEMDLCCGLILVGLSNGNKSIIELIVDERVPTDDDGAESNIPFTVSYAVSIHKSQGLEYDSVKIIIVDEIDEMITHNIFYTAITRTKNELKIFWSPKTQHKVISSFSSKQISDAKIISHKHGIPLIKNR